MKRIHLRDARRAKKLSQAALAKKIRKPQSLISKLETGTLTDTSTTTAKAIGRVLEVDPLALVFGRHREVMA